ncbi:MAG TPA: type II toxin-antitoxin system death-on-curing family toxin [Candidatus Hydrogenedentes bacterium]|nr:type II toxin-antitoxin system death-on-curing family toxin [Candidatus Hydrogenedentota bacterium]
MNPIFLSIEDILEIHSDQIRRYGGTMVIRDTLLLQSAIAQPCAMFSGKFLYHDLFEMASAYLFHLVMNHPFLDGNKRTGGAAALVFLFLNGVKPGINEDSFADMVLSVARGEIKKPEIALFFRKACTGFEQTDLS